MHHWKKRMASILLSSIVALSAAVPATAAEGGASTGGGAVAPAPSVPAQELNIKLIGRYTAPGGETAAEIVAYNKLNQKVYVINGAESSLDILNLADLKSREDASGIAEITYEKRILLSDIGLASAEYDMTSVAVSPGGEYIALAVPGKYTQDSSITVAKKGLIVLLAADGSLLTSYEAGYLPDMVTFTPDGKKILAANEGEPTLNYLDDPQGSVTVVDLTPGVDQAAVTQVGFDQLDADAFDANVRFFPKGQAALSAEDRARDLEPEYIAVDEDSTYAYVTLQENNAIAKLNLTTLAFEHVYALGFKDYSLPENKMDVSDKDGRINIANWPVLAMYQPDGMSLFEKNGKTYLITANEGDTRAYIDEDSDPETTYYDEEVRVKKIASQVQLDRSKYQGYSEEEWNALDLEGMLKDDEQLGRLTVSTSFYTVSGATYHDALYTFGGRSFSIWDTSNLGAGPVFDSGADFEEILSLLYPDYFNISNDNIEKDNRSDNKGPEPEDAEVGVIGGQTYAFIGLERMGGIMVYNITNPAQPSFVTYYTSRDFSEDIAGDVGPEGLQFIPAYYSPTGKALLLAGNEVSGTVSVYEIEPNTDSFPMTILHTNDTHANLDSTSSPDNILRRVTAIKEAKKASVNPIVVDAGDVFSGTLYFNKYEGLADLEFMNLAGYDAMTFGNHEFDLGSQPLANFISKADFPFVAANVDFSKDEILNGYFTNEIGEPGENGHIYPAVIKEVDGERISLFGLTTEDTAKISSPGDVAFDDAIEKAKATVALLEAQGINKIIVLSHLGYDVDLSLAKQVEGIDIIVGGHSHTKLNKPVVDDTHSAPKLIVQTGEKGQFLGRLAVEFDSSGVLTAWDGNLISVDAQYPGNSYIIPGDEEAEAILNTQYKPGVVELKQTVVGQTNVELNGLRADVRTKETNLGNLIADGMLDAAKAAGTDAVIALQNGGGIRTSISSGPITQGQVLEVLPFGNDLVTLSVTGQEIRDALENGVSKVPSQDGRFPHVAGMRFFYDSTKPEFERIVRVEVKDGDSYVPLDLEAVYELATNIFTARGGDFYATFENAYNEGRVNMLLLPDYGVFTGYIQKLGTLNDANTFVEGRIVDLQGADLESEAPVWPADKSLTASEITTSSVKLTWSQAEDNSGIGGYQVLQDGERIATVTGAVYSYNVTGLYSGTSYIFKVEAVDAFGNTTTDGPSVSVRTVSSGSSYIPPSNPGTAEGAVIEPVKADDGSVELKPAARDLKEETAGDGTKVTRLAISADSLAKALDLAGTGTIVVALDEVQGAVKVELPAAGLTQTGDVVIRIQTADKSYDLPLQVVDVNALAASLGVDAEEISILVAIGEVAEETKEAAEAAASQIGVALLTDVVSYTITAEANGKTVEVNGFGVVYVNRTLTLNSTVDPDEATAVAVDETNGKLSFVPAVFEAADGKTVVTIKRNSNSAYTVVQSSKSFGDLQGHWSREDVELLASKLVVDGQTSTQYAPDANVTRAEFATLLVRALGLKEDASEAGSVKDVTSGAWYAGALGAAVKAGLLEGFEDGTLRPEANITRAEMAVTISRALQAAGKTVPSSGISSASFIDGSQIPAWAADAVAKSASAGIIEGTTGNRFAPLQQATRAEAAVMLNRLLKYVDFING